MIVFAIVIGIGILAVIAGLVWIFVRPPHDTSVNHTSHPDPALTAREYLEAIADGDTDAARAIDGSAYDTFPVEHTGTTLLSDEALASAVERISDVKVKLQGATEESASLSTSFTLAGERHVQTLFLVWDATRETWLAERSFASPISVSADNGEFNGSRFVPFRVGGSETLIQESSTDSLFGYAAYPGVYDLVVELDPDGIDDVDANPLERQLVVIPDQDQFPTIIYPLVD